MTPDGDTSGEATCRAQAHHTTQGEGPPGNALQWEHLCPSSGQKLLQSAYTGKQKQQRRGGATSLEYYNWLGKWQPDNNVNDKNGKPHARRARVTSICQRVSSNHRGCRALSPSPIEGTHIIRPLFCNAHVKPSPAQNSPPTARAPLPIQSESISLPQIHPRCQ